MTARVTRLLLQRFLLHAVVLLTAVIALLMAVAGWSDAVPSAWGAAAAAMLVAAFWTRARTERLGEVPSLVLSAVSPVRQGCLCGGLAVAIVLGAGTVGGTPLRSTTASRAFVGVHGDLVVAAAPADTEASGHLWHWRPERAYPERRTAVDVWPAPRRRQGHRRLLLLWGGPFGGAHPQDPLWLRLSIIAWVGVAVCWIVGAERTRTRWLVLLPPIALIAAA